MANQGPGWATKVRKNEATAARRRLYFHLVDDTNHVDPEVGEAGGQPEISIDGAAWTSAGSVIGTLTHIGNGTYYADVSQAAVNINAGTIMGRFKSANTDEALSLNVLLVGAEADNAPNLANETRTVDFDAGTCVVTKPDGSTTHATFTLTEVDADTQKLTRS